MELPPKAIFALIDIKKELLNAKADDCIPEEAPRSQGTPKKESRMKPRTFRGRHAKASNAFQRGCQHRAPWAPVH